MALIAGMKEFLGLDYYRKREMRDKLDLLGAAEAHILWKTRLWHHIQGTIREPLESALIGQAGVCHLGNWIRVQELEPFRGLPAFEQLSEAHLQFHQFGEIIVKKLKLGDRGGAEAVFKSDYSQSLRRIIQALTEINKHLQEV